MNFARSFKKRCIHVIYKFYPQKSKNFLHSSKKTKQTKQEQKQEIKTCDKSVNETMNFSFKNTNFFLGGGFKSGDCAVKITS